MAEDIAAYILQPGNQIELSGQLHTQDLLYVQVLNMLSHTRGGT